MIRPLIINSIALVIGVVAMDTSHDWMRFTASALVFVLSATMFVITYVRGPR